MMQKEEKRTTRSQTKLLAMMTGHSTHSTTRSTHNATHARTPPDFFGGGKRMVKISPNRGFPNFVT
jgi:hypothetical protein